MHIHVHLAAWKYDLLCTRSYFQTFIAQKVSESKIAPEDIGQFSADSLNKAVPSFRNILTQR